jgi:hypothetical protein
MRLVGVRYVANLAVENAWADASNSSRGASSGRAADTRKVANPPNNWTNPLTYPTRGFIRAFASAKGIASSVKSNVP